MTPEMILTAGAIVLAYTAIANRLFLLGRSTRDDFVDAAERLIHDPRVSDQHRAVIWHAGVQFTSAAASWRAVLLLMRAIVWNTVARAHRAPKKDAGSAAAELQAMPDDLAREYKRLIKAVVGTILCNSPAALVIFGLILAFASFAGGSFALLESVTAQLGSEARRADGDACPPPRPI